MIVEGENREERTLKSRRVSRYDTAPQGKDSPRTRADAPDWHLHGEGVSVASLGQVVNRCEGGGDRCETEQQAEHDESPPGMDNGERGRGLRGGGGGKRKFVFQWSWDCQSTDPLFPSFAEI